jgi:hypothetical protein
MLRAALPPLSKPSLIRYPGSTASSSRPYRLSAQFQKPQTASFTQVSRLSNEKGPKSQRSNPDEPVENPSFPAFKLSDLGANRAVKYTVYAVLGVLGTMETIFWTKAIWRYFSPEPSPETEQEQTD